MALVAVALVLIVVPGEYRETQFAAAESEWQRQCKDLSLATYETHMAEAKRNGDPPHVTVQVFEHGWPMPFLARSLVVRQLKSGELYREKSTPLIRFKSRFAHWGGSLYHHVSWSDSRNWPLSADDWTLRPLPLMLNIVASLLIVGACGGLAEWRIRTGRLFRFRLAELLALVSFVGLLLGIYAYHTNLQRHEAAGAKPPQPPAFLTHNGNLTSMQKYVGPVWLRKLVGQEYLLPFFHHVYAVSVNSNKDWEASFDHLTTLPYLESVQMARPMPRDALARLQSCRTLKKLSLALPSSKELASGAAADEVDELFTVDHLPMLGRLSLNSVTLSGGGVRAEHVEAVASLPGMQKVSLRGVMATPQEIEAIRERHQNVTIEVQLDLRRFLCHRWPLWGGGSPAG
jgi:hypothetical protein